MKKEEYIKECKEMLEKVNDFLYDVEFPKDNPTASQITYSNILKAKELKFNLTREIYNLEKYEYVKRRISEEEAHWIEKVDTNCILSIFECSKCKGEVVGARFTFCPHCGRKMISGKIENDPVPLVNDIDNPVPNAISNLIVNEKTTDDYFPKVSDKEIPYSVEKEWEKTLRYERNHDLDSGN